eukprot:COSAG01_NODE_256_length_20138_cov_24.233694_6_plen_725_part_00
MPCRAAAAAVRRIASPPRPRATTLLTARRRSGGGALRAALRRRAGRSLQHCSRAAGKETISVSIAETVHYRRSLHHGAGADSPAALFPPAALLGLTKTMVIIAVGAPCSSIPQQLLLAMMLVIFRAGYSATVLGHGAQHVDIPNGYVRDDLATNVQISIAIAEGADPEAKLDSRRLQTGAVACTCQQCTESGNSVAQCASWGMDCSCLITCTDPCHGCVTSGNSVSSCSSWGMDCAGCGNGHWAGGAVCADDPGWYVANHVTWGCATYAPGEINAGQNTPSEYCGRDVGLDGRTPNQACPVTCHTCPATCDRQAEIQTVNAECCDEPTEDCSTGTPSSCNIGCANVLLPFFDLCNENVGHQFDIIVAKCNATTDACATLPCQNGGVCSAQLVGSGHRRLQGVSNGLHSFQCACPTNYYGASCETFCSVSTCSGHGNCDASTGDCICVVGYTGSQCDVNIDDCASHPCLHGATCVDGVNSYTCSCAAGYAGLSCDVNIDDCVSHPCLHGATCIDAVNSYYCSCILDIYGSPCSGHGTCDTRMGACMCNAGYDGEYCDVNIDDCASQPCLHGATCVDGVNSYTCSCAAGYAGLSCDVNIDDCASHPCLHGATCVDGVNSYTCSCAAGYAGLSCDVNIDDCASHPCLHGATCIDGVNSYTCACATGSGTNYYGSTCSGQGTCDTRMGACMCNAGYDGEYCDNDIDDCASHPCLHGATSGLSGSTYDK